MERSENGSSLKKDLTFTLIEPNGKHGPAEAGVCATCELRVSVPSAKAVHGREM